MTVIAKFKTDKELNAHFAAVNRKRTAANKIISGRQMNTVNEATDRHIAGETG